MQAGSTRLATLRQEGAAKLRFPRRLQGAGPGAGSVEAVMINTAGGMTGGDRFFWAAKAGANTALTLTTQACERVYRSAGGEASVSIRLTAGTGASIAWLPQETILYDASRLSRTIEVDLKHGARLLACETILLGRAAMGERVRDVFFHDRWRVRMEGRLMHAEDRRVDGDALHLLSGAASGGRDIAFATVLLAGPDAEGMGARLREVAIAPSRVPCGISCWPVAGTHKLLVRLAAPDGYELRKRLVPILGELAGGGGLPKLWSS